MACTVVEVNSNLTVIVTVFSCSNRREGSALNRLNPDFDCFHSESVRLNKDKEMKCYFYYATVLWTYCWIPDALVVEDNHNVRQLYIHVALAFPGSLLCGWACLQQMKSKTSSHITSLYTLCDSPVNLWTAGASEERERERESRWHVVGQIILTKMTGRKLYINLLPQQWRAKSQNDDGCAPLALLCFPDWVAVYYLSMIFSGKPQKRNT